MFGAKRLLTRFEAKASSKATLTAASTAGLPRAVTTIRPKPHSASPRLSKNTASRLKLAPPIRYRHGCEPGDIQDGHDVSLLLWTGILGDIGPSIRLESEAMWACSTSQLRNFRNEGFRSLFLG
jgi:hypothetical protein